MTTVEMEQLSFLCLSAKQFYDSVIVEVAQKGESDWESEQTDNAKKLHTDKHAAKGYNRVQTELTADDFRLDDIADDCNDHIDRQKTERKQKVAPDSSQNGPRNHDAACSEHRENIEKRD